MMRAFKIYSFSNFQMYNIVLSTIVNVLYITFPGLTYFITRSLYLLTTFIHFPLTPPPTSGNHLSVLCIYEFG